jgi:4-hydroxyphenylpyruvate dioxygenase
MAASVELGILGMDSFHFFVHRPERSHRFYTEGLGWHPAWRSNDEMTKSTGQRSTVYESGGIRAVVSTPERDTCRAARYLNRHPAGIGSLTFEVEDIDRAWNFLLKREATPIHAIRRTKTEDGGQFSHFSITTAFGDVSFRFLQRHDTEQFAPGFQRVNSGSANRDYRFLKVDHITSNAPTMAAPKLWMEHVLGMEQCWDIAFHTEDIQAGGTSGTGLRSVVMWDPKSGLKFPVNEPFQPFFKEGQINKFIEDNHGAGIQHIALEVDDVVSAVRDLRSKKVEFLNTPKVYYEATPERLKDRGVDVYNLEHKLEELQDLRILIDGKPDDQYLIQVFMTDAMSLYQEPAAGPFFYELIQRCGDDGFGEGNFRALFEAIERAQVEDEP